MSETITATISTTATAATVSTFSTVDGLIKAQAALPHDPVLVAYPATDVDDFEEHTAKDLDRYADAAAAKYKSLGLDPADPRSPKAPVVALLAPSSFEVIITILAIGRLGWALLFLSPRLTSAAHARLLQMAECSTMIVSGDHQRTVYLIRNELPASIPAESFKSLPIITRADYRTSAAPADLPRTPPHLESLQAEKTAWIIHSSGSTGFPKPIPLSHRALLANFARALGLRAFCASPLFHSHGLMELFRCVYRGAPMYMANHARPTTRANLVRAMRVAKPELVTAVPFVLGLLAEGADGVAELARARVVMFAGSACPDAVGDRLVEAGVNLVANYGSSETGAIMSSLRPAGDKEWSYVRLAPHTAPHVLMDEISAGVFECVALATLPSRGPMSVNCADPPGSWRTRDLFARHPDPDPDPARRGWWKYLARLDDRLALVTGEKVLPLPIEGRVRQSPLVAEAVAFGAGRAVPGLLVFRAEQQAGSPPAAARMQMGAAEFVDAVWEAVEAANAAAESFSRIPRELVVPMPAGTEWPRTDKGTVVRQRVYDVFADVIEEAYRRFERDGGQEVDGEGQLLGLTVPELEEWLMERFKVDLGVELQSVESDIFAAGVDSLQTTRMWSTIRKTLDLGAGRDELSQNVVYEKGNVKVLARHLYGLRTGEDVEQSDEDELLAMQELVEKYSVFEPHVPVDAPPPDGEVVLLTGATGGLGAHILSSLLARPDIKHIYALVRAPDATAAQSRILASLASRELGFSRPSLSKLTAVPTSDLSQPNLGFPDDAAHLLLLLLQTLHASLTTVIHAAWPVNFTLPVRAFAPHVAGLHNLLQLCLRVRAPRPASLSFASSVAATGGLASLPRSTTTTTTTAASPDDGGEDVTVVVPEEVPHALAAAQKMGYGRSKLVGEKIVAAAAGGARVLRIGQLVGDLGPAAEWNAREAIPLLVRGVRETGALPALDETPSWLPIDVAAAAILDIALPRGGRPEDQRHGGARVYHILNPQTFGWTRDFVPALQRTGLLPPFEVVSPAEWLERLRDSERDAEKNPSRKLLGFWEGKYGLRAAKKKNRLRYETRSTVGAAPRLGEVPMVDILRDGEWVERVVRRWVSSW